MTHSVRKRKQRERHKKTLCQRIKDIGRLATKHYVEPQVVHLSKVALGDLRRRFSPRNSGFKALPFALKRMDYDNKFSI